MKSQSHAPLALGVAIVVSVIVVYVLTKVDKVAPDWMPEVIVTFTGLIGASWFIARRLDLIDKSIAQREDADTAQLAATERGARSGAVKEAVLMMASEKLTTVLAGQRWLHQIAGISGEEADLVRALLCSYVVSHTESVPAEEGKEILDYAPFSVARQAALMLLFGDPGKGHYKSCVNPADLRRVKWQGVNFTDLDVSGVVFRKCSFTGATVSGTQFDESDLRETSWAGDFGGNDPTSMRGVDMCGVTASSCVFRGISFRDANMGNNGQRSIFRHCRFVRCDFEGATWTGAEFVSPNFEECDGITYELCCQAKINDPKGLSAEVLSELNRMGPAGYQPSGSGDSSAGPDGEEPTDNEVGNGG